MNRTLFLASAVLVLTACHSTGKQTSIAETPKTDTTMVAASATAAPPADSATRMKNMADYMKPGKVHQIMASWAGNWAGDISMWTKPGAKEMKNSAMASYKMIMGGRYLIMENKGTFQGAPFQGSATWAFDNAKRMFITSWIDNFGTGLLILNGTWDGGNNSAELKGKMVDPETGDDLNVREVYHVVDNDRHIMQMFVQQPDGKEYKSMEVIYTRRK